MKMNIDLFISMTGMDVYAVIMHVYASGKNVHYTDIWGLFRLVNESSVCLLLSLNSRHQCRHTFLERTATTKILLINAVVLTPNDLLCVAEICFPFLMQCSH